MLDDILMLLLFLAYVVAGLSSVGIATSDILDEEEFKIKHLLISIVFLPFAVIVLVIILIACLVLFLGDKFRHGKIDEFLNKSIKSRR